MSKHLKFRQKLCTVPTPSDIRWTDLQSYLEHLGYTMQTGKGSRRKFYHREKDALISLHEPHPESIVAKVYIAYVVDHLKNFGFLED